MERLCTIIQEQSLRLCDLSNPLPQTNYTDTSTKVGNRVPETAQVVAIANVTSKAIVVEKQERLASLNVVEATAITSIEDSSKSSDKNPQCTNISPSPSIIHHHHHHRTPQRVKKSFPVFARKSQNWMLISVRSPTKKFNK